MEILKGKKGKRESIIFKGAEIWYKNFGGQEVRRGGQLVNQAGNRNFCIRIDERAAEKFIDDGWKIIKSRPKEEGDAPRYYFKVKVKFANFPPEIIVVNPDGSESTRNEDTIGSLDKTYIENADVTITRADMDVNGSHYVVAYLDQMTVYPQDERYEAF